MKRALAIAFAAAATACGSSLDFSQNCSMNVAVNGGTPQTVSCFAAGALTPSGNAVSLSMTGTLPSIQAADFAMTLPAPPSARTYGSADVNDAGAQVQTSTSAIYTQSKAGSIGSFSVVLTNVNSATANGQTAYFIRGTATVTLVGQGAPGTATITATF